ncbi:MAG: 5'/3'-nucleotidase SurE [Chloroflexota bacterium]
MRDNGRPQILLTNDDGIRSPGLWSAAEALSSLGFVTVAAPRDQSSGAGRSMPLASDGTIREDRVTVGGKTWTVYAIGGTPAQTVLHAVLEIMPRLPDLVVSGINYGENLGSGVTVSGTVGAALEGAALGVPSLAVSLETDTRYHLSHSEDIDFLTAAHFTHLFAAKLLAGFQMSDVDVLKVDVPAQATPDTPWALTRLSRVRYFVPVKPQRNRLDQPAGVGYRVEVDPSAVEPDSDIHALYVRHVVAVTPLSLDLTSRVDFAALERALR